MAIACAECHCTLYDRIDSDGRCTVCTQEVCCCPVIHRTVMDKVSLMPKRRLAMVAEDVGCKDKNCCVYGSCDKEFAAQQQARPRSRLLQFFGNVKGLYAAALGIETLCIAAAEIGENTGLYLFGFNHTGIPFAYAMGYALATFTTFSTILGRYQYGSGNKIDSCCSVLEQGDSKGFISNLLTTFANFGSGLKKMKDLHKQPNLRQILKSTFTILITAETACILAAETVDMVFFKQAIYLSIPLALLAGAFTVVAPESYRKIKRPAKSRDKKNNSN